MIPSVSLSVFQNTPMGKSIKTMLPKYLAMLPEGTSFDDPTWNGAKWSRTPKKIATIDFTKIGNPDLIVLAKIRTLELRLHKQVTVNAIHNMIWAMTPLGHILQARPAKTLTTGDFHQAEKVLKQTYNAGTAFRYSAELVRIATWLRGTLGLPIEHSNTLKKHTPHGRKSMTENRDDKLLPTEVLVDFLAHRGSSDISTRDAFYLNALALQVACGMRAGEMSTLPADCLIEDEGALLVRNFTSKGGRSAPRPVAPQLADMVKEAVTAIQKATQSGRDEAKRLGDERPFDWTAVLNDKEALPYFLALEAHKWTSNPDHRIINPDGAWNISKKKFFDVVGILEKAGGNLSEASRRSGIDRNTYNSMLKEQLASIEGKLSEKSAKRTSWDTDQRVFSLGVLIGLWGNTQIYKLHPDILLPFVKQVQKCQLKGQIWPKPKPNKEFEERCRFQKPVALFTEKGTPALYAQDALFVIEKNALSQTNATKETGIHIVTSKDLGRWLSGEKRSHGTGNHEDAAAGRLNVKDPRTGEPAKITWHDVRHWLNTTYENGGLSQDQIAMLFNRRSTAGNSPYSHTSHTVRADRLRESIKDSKADGHITRAAAALADVDRDKAEAYLKATTRTHNPMPHGVCTLNWAAEPCPHHLSCFSCHTDEETKEPLPCEHLVVDMNDSAQKQEVERLHTTATQTIEHMDDLDLHETPQFEHHSRIVHVTQKLLNGDPT